MPSTVEVMAEAFHEAGTPFIVGHPGGESVELMEAARNRGMRFILVKQESAGAMLAATSAVARVPLAGASVALVPSSVQTYVAKRQPAAVRSMKRVSTGRPNENSFQSFVPTGNRHASGTDPSIDDPLGIWIQRRFVAPSDQSGY